MAGLGTAMGKDKDVAKTIEHRVDEAQISNGAQEDIELGIPYHAMATLKGVAPILLHAWNIASIAEKATAAKGSKSKKSDDLESYAYRTAEGLLGVPGANVHAAIAAAGKFHQDPRSPRKSASDLCKAAIVPLTLVAPFEPAVTTWDYEDQRRVRVQNAGITRVRPAMREGWQITVELLVTLPQYISPTLLHKLLCDAGALAGLCDFRPSYGRFAVTHFEVVELAA